MAGLSCTINPRFYLALTIEVDWAGDPAHIIDPNTGEIIDAWIFVGVMTYSQYAFVEAFINERAKNWITAHVHMYEYFGGVTPILVPDNWIYRCAESACPVFWKSPVVPRRIIVPTYGNFTAD